MLKEITVTGDKAACVIALENFVGELELKKPKKNHYIMTVENLCLLYFKDSNETRTVILKVDLEAGIFDFKFS